MKKIKSIIISIFLFFIIPIISSFLLEKIIPSIYYDCSPTFSEFGYDICMTSSLGLAIPFVLGLGVAVWYFYRSSSSIKSNKKTKSQGINPSTSSGQVENKKGR